jgi:hypothetical protein
VQRERKIRERGREERRDEEETWEKKVE